MDFWREDKHTEAEDGRQKHRHWRREIFARLFLCLPLWTSISVAPKDSVCRAIETKAQVGSVAWPTGGHRLTRQMHHKLCLGERPIRPSAFCSIPCTSTISKDTS